MLQSTFQSQTCTKKGHGHCLVVCCWSDPLQPSESQWNHYIWEVCSTYWWDVLKIAMPAASTGQQNGPSSSPWFRPTAHCITNASKVKRIGLRNFTHLPYSPDLLTTNYHFFKNLKNFLQGKKTLPQPAECRKCFPRAHQTLKHWFLCCRNKQTDFSLAKMCWLQWFL